MWSRGRVGSQPPVVALDEGGRVGAGPTGTTHAATAGDVALQETKTGTGQGIVPVVTGTMGGNGWYTSDVNVAWSFPDENLRLNSIGTCQSGTVTNDTLGETFTCSSFSGTGEQFSASVTIRRDTVVPVLAVSRPDLIVLHDAVAATVSASDATSGVDTASCDPIATSTTGYFASTCSAVDLAGNRSGVSMRYPVVAPFGSFESRLPSTDPIRSGSRIGVKFTFRDVNGPLSPAHARALASNGQVRVVLTTTVNGSGETGPGQNDWFAAPNLAGATGVPANSQAILLK